MRQNDIFYSIHTATNITSIWLNFCFYLFCSFYRKIRKCPLCRYENTVNGEKSCSNVLYLVEYLDISEITRPVDGVGVGVGVGVKGEGEGEVGLKEGKTEGCDNLSSSSSSSAPKGKQSLKSSRLSSHSKKSPLPQSSSSSSSSPSSSSAIPSTTPVPVPTPTSNLNSTSSSSSFNCFPIGVGGHSCYGPGGHYYGACLCSPKGCEKSNSSFRITNENRMDFFHPTMPCHGTYIRELVLTCMLLYTIYF